MVTLNQKEILNEKISYQDITPAVKTLSINYNDAEFNASMSYSFMMSLSMLLLTNLLLFLKTKQE
jgi:hypothetical protein